MTKRNTKSRKSTVKVAAAKTPVARSSVVAAASPPLIVLGFDEQQKPRGALPGFLAQPLEEPIFYHIAPSATLLFTIGAGVALPYSITSSARASSADGIVRPRVRAVCALTTLG
jgi:hypothetical protein